MTFRTLLLGVIVLGLASGWAAHWVAPVLFTLQPDQEVMSGGTSVKCRNVRTVLDKKGGPPGCFEVIADDLATGRYQEQLERDREEREEPAGLTEEDEQMIERLRERYQSDDE